MSSRQVAMYRALLRVYPRRFRGDYRDEMTQLFADQLRDTRADQGWIGVVRLWICSLVDLVVTAPGQHLESEEVFVTSPVGVPDQPIEQRSVSRRVAFLVALIPLWTVIFISLVGPGFMYPVYESPPGILGLPVGVVILAAAIAWMSIGAAIVAWTTSMAVRLAALQVFAIPSTVLILLAPAGILVLQHVMV